MVNESIFQSGFVKTLRRDYPGAIVFKTDSQQTQGIPDILMLYGSHWFAFEMKKYKDASHRPNQDYYIKCFSKYTYAAFVYPENVDEVLANLRDITIKIDNEENGGEHCALNRLE